jgi:hypothetical protein
MVRRFDGDRGRPPSRMVPVAPAEAAYGFEPAPRPNQPSPKKTHRPRQQLDWGRCGVCLLPSLSKHSVDGGATDLQGLGDLRSPHALCFQLAHLGHVDRRGPFRQKVLTREEALHELRERGLDPRLIDHLRRLPFPEEEKTKLDEIYPEIVDLEEDEYTGDKQPTE